MVIRTLAWASVVGAMIFAELAHADDLVRAPRTPLRPIGAVSPRAPLSQNARARRLLFQRYEQIMTVVRERSPGKSFATFAADPQPLEPGSQMVFEIRSESGSGGTTPRWRCVASRDVAECLGAPVRIRYLSGDRRIVLSLRVRPASRPELGEVGVAAREAP